MSSVQCTVRLCGEDVSIRDSFFSLSSLSPTLSFLSPLSLPPFLSPLLCTHTVCLFSLHVSGAFTPLITFSAYLRHFPFLFSISFFLSPRLLSAMSAILQKARTGAIAALQPHLACGLQQRAMQTTADGQLVQLGRSSIPLSTDSRLQRLTPDNEHMGSVQRLREALDKKGYLYLKQLQPRDKVRDLLTHVSHPS